MDIFLKWLKAEDVTSGVGSYDQFEVTEASAYDEDVHSFLVNELKSSRIHETLEERLRERLGAEKFSELLAASQPKRPNTRKGDFGEILAALSLSAHFGYEVPVKKLRYKMRSGDQPTNIDVVAFKRHSSTGAITEVCYVESKLRTTVDKLFALDAHEQLRSTWESSIAELHIFLGNVLADRRDPLLEPFLEYMSSFKEDPGRTTFCLALHSETSAWRPENLSPLLSVKPMLSPLTVIVFKIPDIASRIKTCFEAVGLELDHTDD